MTAISPVKIRENAFRDTVVAHAKYRGWLVYWTWNSKHSPAGFPDLFMVRGDRIVVAELKVGRNKPTAAQRQWLDAFDGAGIVPHLWRPEDFDEIEEVLM